MASPPESSQGSSRTRTPAAPAPRVAPVRNRRVLADAVSGLIAREFILSGVIPEGELLPSEKELAERYGVSRVTTRASLRTLREAGLITVRQGVGSIVLPRSEVLRLSLDRLASVETFARESGREVETDDFQIELQAADADTARIFELDEGEAVVVVPRAKLYQGTRVAWLIDYVRQDVLPLETIRAEMEGSVLDVLLAHEELAVDYAECEIEPVAFSGDIATKLHVKPGTVGLFMDEVVYTVDGRAVGRCLGWHLHLPAYRRFFVRRRRPVSDY